MSAVVRIQLPQFSLELMLPNAAWKKDEYLISQLTPEVVLGKFHRLPKEAERKGLIFGCLWLSFKKNKNKNLQVFFH